MKQIININQIIQEYFDQPNKIGGKAAFIAKHFGSKKFGINYFLIPPGYRTSLPHAEKCEDEFVYIISGVADMWFNGHIKQMSKGDAIGFPAGTGIGHSFINNSEQNLELFVVGEPTKSENQYHFPVSPEKRLEIKLKWWDQCPPQVIGSHNGLPGIFTEDCINNNINIKNGFNDNPEQLWSYPNDSETFGHGYCLSRKFGIKSFVVNFEKLPPNKRSSWPHAHSNEEEFVFILEGMPTAYLNGEDHQLSPHDAVDFKVGSGIAHCLKNQTEQNVYYICVGEESVQNDLIYYPEHPSRNDDVKKEGWFWEDCPLAKAK